MVELFVSIIRTTTCKMKLLQVLLVGLTVGIIAADFEWKYPESCDIGLDDSCDYTVKVIPRGNFVDVTIVSKQQNGTWAGFGLAKTKELKNVGLVWGCVNESNYGVVVDSILPDQNTAPYKMPVQPLQNSAATYSNGYITVNFSHPIISYESYEFNLTDGNCFYPVVPLGGGKCLNEQGTIEKPFKTPMMPDFMVCFNETQVTGTLPTVSVESIGSSTKLPFVTGSSVHDLTMITATENPLGLTKKIAAVYFDNTAQYRLGNARFSVEHIDPSICTHIFYAFANMSENFTLIPTQPNDVGPNGGYERVNELKEKNPDLKTLLVLGGEYLDMVSVKNMLETEVTRSQFIESLINTTRFHGFDGCEIDIFYHAPLRIIQEIKDHFTVFMKELRARITEDAKKTGQPELLLTVTIPGDKEIIEKGIDVKTISKYVDWFNWITEHLRNYSLPVTQLQAPLFAGDNTDEQRTVAYLANLLASMGVPKDKIVLGMTTIAYGYKLKDPKNHDLGAPVVGLSSSGNFTQVSGELAYYELCSMLIDNSTKVFLDKQKASYTWTPNGEWFSFDDAYSLIIKANWLKKEGYRGYFVWKADSDDFKGDYCNMGPYPLIKTLYDTLMGSVTSRVTGSVTGSVTSRVTGSVPPLTKILERSTTLVHKMETTTIKK